MIYIYIKEKLCLCAHLCIFEMQSLCNACGIRFKKEERRATAAASTTSNNNGSTSGGLMEQNHMLGHHNNSWYAHSQNQKMPCYSPSIGNEFRFIEDNEQNSDTGIPFLSWRLNVTDRPSLVHDFTRWKIDGQDRAKQSFFLSSYYHNVSRCWCWGCWRWR